MQLSHRDHRVDRALAGGMIAMVALILGGVGWAWYAPWPALGVGAVAALALGSGWYVVRAGRLVQQYERDVGSIHDGVGEDAWTHYEASRPVPRDPPVGLPRGRSPNVRPPLHGGGPP